MKDNRVTVKEKDDLPRGKAMMVHYRDKEVFRPFSPPA